MCVQSSSLRMFYTQLDRTWLTLPEWFKSVNGFLEGRTELSAMGLKEV